MAPTLSSSSQLVKQGPEVGTDKTKKKKKKEERKISRPEAKARLLEDLGLGEGVGGIEDAYFNGIFDRLDLRATGFLSEGDYARMRGFVESSSVKKKLGTLKQDQARAKAKAHELEQQRTTQFERRSSELSMLDQAEGAQRQRDIAVMAEKVAMAQEARSQEEAMLKQRLLDADAARKKKREAEELERQGTAAAAKLEREEKMAQQRALAEAAEEREKQFVLGQRHMNAGALDLAVEVLEQVRALLQITRDCPPAL